MFIAAVSDSNGGTGVRLVCKTSEKLIPADVVSRSEVLQEILDERRKVKCDLNWSAACNWVSWDPWEDPGWPASEVCKALKVADYMSDTELEALASIVAERVAAHVPATPISKPLSRSLSKVVSSFKSALGGRRKPAWNSERKASSGSLPPPVDASEDLLRAIELLPEHLIALVLRPYDMHAVLRIPTATPRPKLLLALQKPTLPSRASSSLPSGTDDADTCTPSDTSTTSALDPITPPATSRPSHDLQQDTHMLPFAHIGSHAAAYLAIQLPALHTHLTPNNSPLAAPQSLLSLDLSHNNLASRTPNASTPFKTPLDALAAHLSALTALHSLNISFNSIAAADSVARLGAALRQLEWLQELNISHNLIDSDAAAKLALCLPAVTALTSLDISANRIGSLGAKAISAALFLPPDQLQRHPSHRGLPAASPSPQPSPSPPPPADSPAPADPADPDMLPESPTTPTPPAPENEVFSRAEGRSESPMELLDLSHNDIEPPGLLEVAVTFAQAGGRACHLSTLDLSYNCRAAHERLVRSLKSSASFSPQESAYARAYARVPAGDGLSLLPAGVLADGCGYEGTGGVDMLEALIAMAPFLVAENLPALESLRMCVFVARGDAEMVSEESIMATSHFQRERTAGESWGPPAPRWGMGAAPKGQHAASAAQPGGGGGRGAAPAHTRDGSGSSGPPCVRDGPGMELLGESLATFGGTLRRLDVRGLPLFAGEGARGIARGLGALTQLTSLDLSATDAGTALCGGGGLVAFSQLTGGPTDTESGGGDATAAPALGPGTEFLTRMTALKRLDLSECGIDGDRVEHEVLEGFARHLSALADLEELNLAGNGLKGGLVVVMPQLATLSALRALSIADNRITAAHFARLGDGLAALSGLTRLDASANRLGGARRNGESAAGAVVDCLTQLTALQELHLSYNRLRQEDAAVLLPPLQALTVLRRVFLKQHGRLDASDAKKFLGDKEGYVV